jgi:hypothetical protein
MKQFNHFDDVDVDKKFSFQFCEFFDLSFQNGLTVFSSSVKPSVSSKTEKISCHNQFDGQGNEGKIGSGKGRE